MTHMQFLVERSSEEDGDPCGHALMASCPPEPFPGDEIPFGHNPTYLEGTAPKTWDVSKGDLANLLDLSKRLNLDGEITPVMAWGMVLGHPRFSDLSTEDFKSICGNLGAKIRCYGYVSHLLPQQNLFYAPLNQSCASGLCSHINFSHYCVVRYEKPSQVLMLRRNLFI